MVRYLQPGPGRHLAADPVLESWDQVGSPSQKRLRSFLAEITDWLEDLDPVAPLSLSLMVAMRPGRSVVSGGHDLDNYLLPIVRHLGHQRFCAVFGRKVAGGTSTLGVEAARVLDQEQWQPKLAVRTTAAGDSPAWKREVADACAASVRAPLPPGPVKVQVHYRLSARRNWAQQWKPTIDALGAVLGVPDPSKPYRPNDDRIVDLELTRTIDEGIGWNIDVLANWVSL